MTNVLFVTWDGPHLPYLESLFLPIFRELGAHGFRFHVLQFTWADEEERRAQRRASEAAGATYSSSPVLRGPRVPSTAATVALGAAMVRYQAKRRSAHVLLFRSILPAAMALLASPGSSYALAFESDGLAADERLEFAGWSPTGATYRAWRAIEARAVRVASVVVTRTEAARSILAERGGPTTSLDKFFVIPNSRDPAVFGAGSDALRANVRAEWGISLSAPCMLYAGSIGPQYHLDEMLSFFRRVSALRPDSRLVLLTTGVEAARSALARAGVEDNRAIVRSVPPSAIARHIAAADLGLALRTPTFSQRAVSPVKVAEYLLCGVPALSTPVGDLAKQLEASAGLLIPEPRPAELDRGAAWFVDSVLPHREAFRARCREVGLRHFALEDAVRRYRAALHCALAAVGQAGV